MQTIEKDTVAQVNWELNGSFVLAEDIRTKAQEILQTTAFPTTKNEAWKYTRVGKIKNGNFAIQQPESLSGIAYPKHENALQYVFVNGHFCPELSATNTPDGIKIQALSSMDPVEVAVFGKQIPLENEVFNALNTAYATDGLYVHVTAKFDIEPVIELIHINTLSNTISNLRHILVAEAFSKVNFVQHSLTQQGESNFTNVITEVRVGKNAQLSIDKLQEENESCFQIASEYVTQQTDSQFAINTLTLNGGLVRNNLSIAVEGTNCETHLNGAYVLDGNQLVDNHTVVDHIAPHCQSNELYKGVINGKATAVFNGKVFVRKDAQKINAFQSNGNILLSEDASVNSKPELEIYADDVKCSHGSTTGQLDETALFYLRARGISETSAKQLLVGAFIGDVIEKINNESVRERVHALLHERFDWIIE